MNTSEILHKFIDSRLQTAQIRAVVGEVVSVDEEGCSCEVNPISNEATLYDVRLSPANEPGLLLVPAVGSVVVVGFLSAEDAYVAQYSTLSKAIIKVGDTSLTIKGDEVEIKCDQESLLLTAGKTRLKSGTSTVELTAQGVHIERAGVNLSTVLTQLCTQLSAATTLVAGVPTPLTNAPAFAIIQNSLNQVLK